MKTVRIELNENELEMLYGAMISKSVEYMEKRDAQTSEYMKEAINEKVIMSDEIIHKIYSAQKRIYK